MRSIDVYKPEIWSSPLQQHREWLQQRQLEAPEVKPALKTSPFERSPISLRNEAARADMQAGRFAATQVPPVLKSHATPAYSRGTHVLHDSPGLQVYTELGPLMWNRVLRGGETGRHIDIYA